MTNPVIPSPLAIRHSLAISPGHSSFFDSLRTMAQAPLNLLCVETRFPGRLGGVADWLVRRRGYRCRFFCHQAEPAEHWPAATGRGLDVVQFNVGGVARESSVPWSRGLERGLCHAYGAWEVVDARRPRPIDVVLGRSSGLGSTLFLPVSFARTPTVNLFDYYVHPRHNDLADEDGSTMPAEYFHWRRSANAMDLLDLENGVAPWTPTTWQRDLFPPEYRDEFFVLFDGITPATVDRRPGMLRSIAGRAIAPETRVVSFIARTLDRLRGFDRFAALAARLQRERSDVLCVAVGLDLVNRMVDLKHYGQHYAAQALAEAKLPDPSRFWSLGFVAPSVVAEVLAASDLHIVPSRSYPVARSLIEALGAGAVVLAWDTAPIRETLKHGQTGLLVPTDDPDQALRTALAVVDDPAAHRPIGEKAAELVRTRYDREVTLPNLAAVFDELVAECPPQRSQRPRRRVFTAENAEKDERRPTGITESLF